MARTKAQDARPEFVDPATVDDPDMELLTTAPDEWEFETVVDESPTGIALEVGESVILQYKGEVHVERELDRDGKDQSFDYYLWQGRDGKPYSLPKSFKLERAMTEVKLDDWCRITYTKDIDTGRGLNPMKDYKVERRTR